MLYFFSFPVTKLYRACQQMLLLSYFLDLEQTKGQKTYCVKSSKPRSHTCSEQSFETFSSNVDLFDITEIFLTYNAIFHHLIYFLSHNFCFPKKKSKQVKLNNPYKLSNLHYSIIKTPGKNFCFKIFFATTLNSRNSHMTKSIDKDGISNINNGIKT